MLSCPLRRAAAVLSLLALSSVHASASAAGFRVELRGDARPSETVRRLGPVDPTGEASWSLAWGPDGAVFAVRDGTGEAGEVRAPRPAGAAGTVLVTAVRRADDGSLHLRLDGQSVATAPGPLGEIAIGPTGRREGDPSVRVADEPPTDADPLPGVLEAHEHPRLDQVYFFVRFADPRDADATLVVVDEEGREVVTLPAAVERGSAFVVWDGRDAAGATAGAGDYVARLDGAGESPRPVAFRRRGP